jgi:hypothetical protein
MPASAVTPTLICEAGEKAIDCARATTSAGELRSANDPSPSCPALFLPQHRAHPPVTSAQLCEP